MSKDFDIQDSTFESFCKSYVKIEIPSYQRMYDWTKKEWNDLWSDLEPYVDNESEYFMGPLNAERDPSGGGVRIADGQQRITTLMILLAALGTVASKTFRERINTVLFSNYEKDVENKKEPVLRLVDQTPEGRSLLASVLIDPSDIPEAQSKHQVALSFFLDTLREKSINQVRADKWCDLVLTRLIFARVVAQGSGAGIKMFERSNNRGRPLTFIDRFKSLLIAESDAESAEEVVQNWSESVTALRQADRFTDMTLVSWIAADYFDQEEKILRLNDAYPESQKAIAGHSSLEVSRKLLSYCKALVDIRKGFIPRTLIRCGSLENAQHFGKFSQLLRLLPAARGLNAETFIEFSKQVENTICVIAIAQAFPPDIEKQIPEMLHLLRDETTRSPNVVRAMGILKKIRNHHTKDFGGVVFNGSYVNLRKTYIIVLWDLMEQYVENLNKNSASQKDRQAVILTDYTVEHILAKSPKAREAAKEFGPIQAEGDRQRFANLTPLEPGNNYGIKPYSEKVTVYEGSKFYLTKTMSSRLSLAGSKALREKRTTVLAPYRTWNHVELMKRAERIYWLAALTLDFERADIKEEAVSGFQFEKESQLPRMHGIRQIIDALQLFNATGSCGARALPTLRFLGLLIESELGDDQISQDGEDLLTVPESEQQKNLTKLIEETPFVLVWQDLSTKDKDFVLKSEMDRLYGQEKPVIAKQVRDCLDHWSSWINS